VLEIPGVVLWQMNHPRDVGSGYSSFIAFDPTTGATFNTSEPMEWRYDMMEVKEYVGSPGQYLESADAGIAAQAPRGSGDIPTMRDWFGWLNLGHPIAGVANSDSHFRNHAIGWGRSLVRLGRATPEGLTDEEIAAAVKAEKVVVSFGPFVQAYVDGVEHMGHADPVAPGIDGKVTIRLKVQAPTWMDVSSLEVYANGRPLVLDETGGTLVQSAADPETSPLVTPLPLATQPANGVVRTDTDLVVQPVVDTWYVFLVRGTGGLFPLAGGSPLAYTNAVYVDVDGNGFKGILQ